MMSFYHQTGANICQISENQWREVHFMREGEHSTCPIKIWRGFAREKLTSQYLLYRPFPDLPTELQKQEEKQKTFCCSEQWNKHKHLDSFWNNDSLIVIFSSFFLQEQAQTSENKCRTVFNTCKQTHMRVLELFLKMFNLAKNLMCASCLHPFNC